MGTLEILGGRYTGRVTEFNFSIGRYRGRVTEFHFGIGRCRGRVGKWPKPVIRLTASRLTAQPYNIQRIINIFALNTLQPPSKVTCRGKNLLKFANRV